METSGSSGLPLTSFNVEAFLRRLKCLFLRRSIELLNDEVSDTTGDDSSTKAGNKKNTEQ